MSMKNKTIIMSILLLLAPFAIIAIWLLPLLQIERLPRPAIRHGEFPFRLVYELNGEEVIIEDTIIARFDGVVWNIGHRSRRWRGYLAGESVVHVSRPLYLQLDAVNSIYFRLGTPAHYMGDRNPLESSILFPGPPELANPFHRVEQIKTSGWSPRFTEEELLENYGIRIISWDPSPPIRNRFR